MSATSSINPKITLGILMGLPASGKTTLCNQIIAKSQSQHELNEESKSKAQVILLSFDHFVPISIQSYLANLAQNEEDSANINTKLIRQIFLKLVEYLIAKFQQTGGFEIESEPLEETFIPVPHEIKQFINPVIWIEKLRLILPKEPLSDSLSLIFLIDDNNYYQSMRNDYYSICKRQKVGFSILYTKTPVKICQERNLLREPCSGSGIEQVPSEVIIKMDQKLEEPELTENPVDAYCFNIMDSKDPGIIDIVYNILLASLDSPVDVEPQQFPDRSEERRICAENEIHQADLVLRKWIHKEVTKIAIFDRKNLPKIKEQFLKKKEEILNGLRSGELQLTSKVGDEYEFSQEILKAARQK